MGKEGELWDDSALIEAFDNAISTYMNMHKGENKDSSGEAEGEKVMGTSNEESGSNVESGNLDIARDAEEKSKIPATAAPDSDETSCVSKLEQNHHAESVADQTCLDSTSGHGIHSEQDGYAYAQGVHDYNQLVAQYNELEEKRLKIWEQLNQYNGWNYQYAATATSSGVPYSNAQGVHDYNQLVAQYNELEEKRLKIWGQLNQYSGWNYQYAATATSSGNAQGVHDHNQLVAQYNELEEKRLKIWEQLNQYRGWNYQYAATATSCGVPYSNAQDYSMSAYQVSDPNVVCTCCPCFSQCMLASCTSVPACSVGGSCVGKPCNHHSVEMDHKMLFPCEDSKIRKMAMGAAERALSTIRTTVSGDSNINEENERKISEPEQINGSETDLTAVLKAWYSTGFYTGKYLAEQSIANRRQK